MKTKRFTPFMVALAGSVLAVGSMNAQETPHQRDSLMSLNKNAIQQIAPGQGHAAGQSGFWGYAFGDYAYMAKGDSAGRGTKQQYKGLGANSAAIKTPNAFEIRRAYLGYDYNINKHFSAYALLAYEGDEDVSDNRTVYLKYIYLKWKNIWKNSNLRIGQQATNSFASDYNTEPLMGYRASEKTIMDMHGMDGSSDMGLELDGRLWTHMGGDTSKVPTFIGYSAMVGDNSGNNPVPAFTGTASSLAAVPSTSSLTINPINNTTDNAKKFRGQLYVNCLNNTLTVGAYADYINYGDEGFHDLNGKSSSILQQAVMTQKVYAVYNSKWFGVGGELVMQSMKNGEIEAYKVVKGVSTGTNDTTTAEQMGFSVFAHGTIIQNTLNVFARYDMYTPDTKYAFNANETFTSFMSNVSSSGNGNSYKETFMNFGLDWTPTKDKKVHIMPNVWYYGIKNGYGADNLESSNYMLYRVTFLFAFN